MSNHSDHREPRIASYQLAVLALLEAAELITAPEGPPRVPAGAPEGAPVLVGAGTGRSPGP